MKTQINDLPNKDNKHTKAAVLKSILQYNLHIHVVSIVVAM